MGLGQRAAENREVLGEHEHRAPVDGAPAGDDAVAGNARLLHAEIGRAVLDEHVELLERAVVEQKLDALAGGQLAARMLRRDAFFAAPEPRLRAPVFELIEHVFHGEILWRTERTAFSLSIAGACREIPAGRSQARRKTCEAASKSALRRWRRSIAS